MGLKETLLNGLATIFVLFAFHGYIENVWVTYFYHDWERVYFNKCFALTFLGYGALYLFLDKEEIFDDYLAQFCRPDQV